MEIVPTVSLAQANADCRNHLWLNENAKILSSNSTIVPIVHSETGLSPVFEIPWLYMPFSLSQRPGRLDAVMTLRVRNSNTQILRFGEAVDNLVKKMNPTGSQMIEISTLRIPRYDQRLESPPYFFWDIQIPFNAICYKLIDPDAEESSSYLKRVAPQDMTSYSMIKADVVLNQVWFKRGYSGSTMLAKTVVYKPCEEEGTDQGCTSWNELCICQILQKYETLKKNERRLKDLTGKEFNELG